MWYSRLLQFNLHQLLPSAWIFQYANFAWKWKNNRVDYKRRDMRTTVRDKKNSWSLR